MLAAVVVLLLLAAAVSVRSPLQLWALDRFARCWGQRLEWRYFKFARWVANPLDRLPDLPAGVHARVSRRFCGLVDAVTRKRRHGRSTRAITIGRTIIFRDGREVTGRLVRHEMEHVRQWKERGWYAATAAAEIEAEAAEEHNATAAV